MSRSSLFKPRSRATRIREMVYIDLMVTLLFVLIFDWGNNFFIQLTLIPHALFFPVIFWPRLIDTAVETRKTLLFVLVDYVENLDSFILFCELIITISSFTW